ncbi:hypothetical protein [Streptomyces mirabilis]|jgi:hypothetical protein|uniref:Uncharacterized protein n=1 Tax=Streptomyces mirabilis TaxID=68239 RepID=A0A1I2KLA2_9ACTN|nr:hypothetical protein [Streptomyces mirabilis]SFF66027.1 hypothetical protein SAMN02787118_110133 [Streptomyces mirabilis]
MFRGASGGIDGASAYLATIGHTGLRAHLYPRYLVQPHSRVVVTELRAVYWGLKAVLGAHPGQAIEVRVDNLQALRHLRSSRYRACSTAGPRLP